MHPNYRGVAFLLSLGSLPIACNNDDRDPTGGSNSTTGTNPTGNTGTDTTDAATDDPPTTAPTTADTTTGGATEPQPTTFVTSDTGTSLDTGDETGPTTRDPTCVAYGAHVVECMPRYVTYQEYIAKNCVYAKAYGLDLDGQPCADAYDALYVCLSLADCAALEQGDACMTEGDALETACPSMQSGGDTDTGGSTA